MSIFFDIETGGLQPSSPIIQFAGIAVDRELNELESLEMKLKFDEATAEPEALKLNHYDPKVWEVCGVEQRSACEQISAFMNRHRTVEMISKRTGNPYTVAVLIGHNAVTFDAPRLQKLFKDHNMFMPADPRIRCTVQRALWYFDESTHKPPADYKLGTLCSYFGITSDGDTHDALVDVRLCIELARRLRRKQ